MILKDDSLLVTQALSDRSRFLCCHNLDISNLPTTDRATRLTFNDDSTEVGEVSNVVVE